MIFAYRYWCCVFKHICGDRLEVPKGMSDSTDLLPPEFFVNPECPPVQAAVEATATKVPMNEAAKEPVEVATIEGHGRL